jgi:xanthine dehydrogenase accessory factor
VTDPSMLQRAAELAAAGSPFALATVTWRRGPSSGKGGSRAVIHPDGRVEGWLGGACAEPTVVRQALEALQDGRSRLLVLGEDDHRPEVTAVAMACSSEGAMEVFVEPMLPTPDVWVVGRSPAVSTLADLVAVLGWTAHVVQAEGTRPVDLTGVGERSAVVVATQGHYDEPALEAALATPAGYIGLIASAKRAAAVREWLRGRGLGDEQLSRVRAPAGLDLGATEHREIAVAVLAELVALKATRTVAPAVEVAEPERAVDPVCGMTVEVATARFVSRYGDRAVYFCAAGCQRAYDADPTAFPSAVADPAAAVH